MSIAIAEPFPDFAISLVAKHYGVTREAILSRCRTRGLCEARFVAYRLLRKFTRLSCNEIAHLMNRSEHGTVINGMRTIQGICDTEPAVASKVAIIESICVQEVGMGNGVAQGIAK